MKREIEISVNQHRIRLHLRNTSTADAVFDALPFESTAQTWGDEVYFSVPVSNQTLDEDAKDVVELGEIAYWVEGDCIAIGFGPTPISHGNEIRLAARTNIWAHSDDDLTSLKSVRSGDTILVSAVT